MKKTTLIAMTLAASLVLVTGSVNAAQTMKPFHKGVSCEACHGEKAPTAPTKTDCSSCHGTPEDVAKLTAVQSEPPATDTRAYGGSMERSA